LPLEKNFLNPRMFTRAQLFHLQWPKKEKLFYFRSFHSLHILSDLFILFGKISDTTFDKDFLQYLLLFFWVRMLPSRESIIFTVNSRYMGKKNWTKKFFQMNSRGNPARFELRTIYSHHHYLYKIRRVLNYRAGRGFRLERNTRGSAEKRYRPRIINWMVFKLKIDWNLKRSSNSITNYLHAPLQVYRSNVIWWRWKI
jgi:hypothetical protein